jgi:hypothetical protein
VKDVLHELSAKRTREALQLNTKHKKLKLKEYPF